MADEKAKWDNKFSSREDTLLPPEDFLLRNMGHFTGRAVLDLACGDGRNAIFLARNGFEVTAVDFSPEALRRLHRFAGKEGLRVRTREVDLTSPGNISGIGVFDSILVSHYKPAPSFWALCPKFLTSAGVVVFCTFNMRQHELAGFPENYCLREGEFKQVPGLKLVKQETFAESGRHLDGYVFRKI